MVAERLSVSLSGEAAAAVRKAASDAGMSVSGWVERTVGGIARRQAGLQAMDDYEAEHGAFTRDTAYLMMTIAPVLMFATPVFWSHETLGPDMRLLMYLNILTGFIEVIRDIVVFGQPPGSDTNFDRWHLNLATVAPHQRGADRHRDGAVRSHPGAGGVQRVQLEDPRLGE